MSRFNATKHGMRAETPVLPGEDKDRYERRLAALVARHNPQDDDARYEVERAANAWWRMERGELVDAARAEQAINDICRSEVDAQADAVERLAAELADRPAATLRRLRRTSAGCLFCLAQYQALQDHLAARLGLLGTQRHRALHLAGVRMTDVLADDPLALCWFLAVIGATYGNQGETLDTVTKSVGNVPPEGMGAQEFEIRVKDLAAQVPGQAEGRARLLAYIAEAVAELREHLAFVQELEEADLALAVQVARIDLGAEGKQLLKYQATQERSYEAALRRLEAVQNGGRAGPGRPPKKGAAPVAVPATQAPVTRDTETPAGATAAAVATDPEAVVATTTAATAGPGTTIEATVEAPAGDFTNEAKTSPAATVEAPAGDITNEAKTSPAATIGAPAGDITNEAKTAPATTVEAPAGDITNEAKTAPAATIGAPAGDITNEAKTGPAATTAAGPPPGTTGDGPRSSIDVDESDLDDSDAEFLRLREVHRMVERVYGGRAAGANPAASGEEALRPPPSGP